MKRLVKKCNNEIDNVYEKFNKIISDVCNKIPELRDEELDTVYEEKRYEYDNSKDALEAALYEVEEFLSEYMYDGVDDEELVQILKEAINNIQQLNSGLQNIESVSEKESKLNEVCMELISHTNDISWQDIYPSCCKSSENSDEALQCAKDAIIEKCNKIIKQLGDDENVEFYKEQVNKLNNI